MRVLVRFTLLLIRDYITTSRYTTRDLHIRSLHLYHFLGKKQLKETLCCNIHFCSNYYQVEELVFLNHSDHKLCI